MLPLVAGFFLGLLGTLAAAGPLAILVASRALEGRRAVALRLALGGALAEALWAGLAASGLALALAGDPAVRRGVAVVGPLLALAVGVALVAARPLARPAPSASPRAFTWLGGFLLVALNPSFLLAWLGSCALLASHDATRAAVAPGSAVPLAAGAALGAFAWYAILVQLLSRHAERAAPYHRAVVRGLGALLIVLGTLALVGRVLG